MQTNDGALLFQVSADISNAQRDIEAIKKQFEQMTRKAVEEGKKQADVWQNLLKGATAYFTLQGAQSFISQMIAVRSQFQQLEISFGTMLKSKEKANALMAQMADLASKTPFGLEEVSEGAKRLLAFQVPAEEVTETLRRMGDVASGLGVPMGQLIHVYGQVKAQGKLMTNDLYQFMNAGIPIIAELSKVVGKSETEIKEMVSAGKIGFPEVQAVIKNMTDEGGLFFNLMAEQSKSLGGQISNLKDNFDQMLNEIGKSSEDIVSGAIKGVSFLVENYQTLGKIIAGLIVTYGTYKTAIIVHNALIALNTQLTNGWTITQLAQYRGLLLLEKAQKLLNATMLANPYVLVATAVVGLGVALWTLKDNTNLAKKAQEDYNKEKEQIIDNEKAHKQRIDELIESVNNQALADTDRQKALIALQKEYPKIFEKYDIETLKLADILKLKKEIAKIDEEKGKESRKNSQQRYKNNADTLLKIGKGEIKGGFDAIVKNSDLDKDISKAFGKYWRYNPMLDFREIYQYFVEKEKVAKNDVKGDAVASWASNLKNLSEEQVKKELEHRQKLIADLQKQKKAGNKWASHGVNFGGDWFAFNEEELQAQSKTLQAQLDRLHEKKYEYKDLTKEYTQAVKDAEKALDNIRNGGLGKLEKEELANAIKEAEGNLEKAKNKLKEHQTSLNKKAPATSKKEQSFDQEAHLLQTQRIAIDNELAEQKKGVDALQEGYDKELALIHYFYDEKAEAIRRGGEDARIALEKERANSKGLMSNETYNARLNAINENEMIANEQNNALKTQQEQKLFDGLLEKYQTYTDQRKAIEEKYNADITALQAKLGADAPQVKKAQDEKARELKKLDILYKKEGTAIAKLFDNLRKKTVKEIRQTITDAEAEIDALASTLNMSDNANVEFIANLRQQLGQVRDTAERSDTAFGRLGKNIQTLFKAKPNTAEWQEAFNGMLSSAQSITGEFAQLGQEFEKLGQSTGNESLKRIGQTMQNVSNVLNRTASFAQIGSAAGPWGAAIGAVVGLITSGFESAAKARMEHEKKLQEIANSKINQQSEYNRLLYEERMLHKENTSVFGTKEVANALYYLTEYRNQWNSLQKDITSGLSEERRNYLKERMEKGFNPFSKSSKKEWEEKVSELVAKQSKLQNIMVADGSHTTGVLWWKKAHTIWKSIIDVHPNLIKANGEFNNELAKSIVKNKEFGGSGKQALQDIIDSYERAQEAQKKFDEYVKNTFGELGTSVIDSVYNALQKGEDAFDSFAKSVGNVIGKLGKQLAYELFVADHFKRLQEKITQAEKNNNGSEDFAQKSSQIVSEFGNAMKSKVSEMETFLKQWNEMGKANGFEFLNEQRKATEKGFARMTQDAGEELNGRFTLMTVLEKQTVDSIKEMHQSFVSLSEKQLRHLANIDTNTYQLHQVRDDVSGMKKDISGMKRGIDELTNKGIKIRT